MDYDETKILMFAIKHADYTNQAGETYPVIATRMTVEDNFVNNKIRFNTYSVLFSKRVDVNTVDTYQQFVTSDFRMTVFTKQEYERYLKEFIEKLYPESQNAEVATGYASVLSNEDFDHWWDTEGKIEYEKQENIPVDDSPMKTI